MTGRPSVAVVVATKDRADLLPACLASIAADLRAGDELVVAEAGSGGAAEVVAALAAEEGEGPSLRCVQVPEGGKSRQLNRGVAASEAALVLLTDDDCRVPPGWTDGLAAPFADPTVAIAFGPIRGLTVLPGSAAPEPLPVGEAPFATWTYAHGASYAVRRSVLDEVGGFDERLGPGSPAHGEEHDLLLRLRERGHRAWIADAPAVEHVDWRSPSEEQGNALVYERGAGAFLGAAVRRDVRGGWPLLRQRGAYLRTLVAERRRSDPRFAARAVGAFAGGLVYGLRLRPWTRPRPNPRGPA